MNSSDHTAKGKRASRTVIIPAAGYGTRVGSPTSKEMLLRPGSCAIAPGKPMIQGALQLAQSAGAKPHVISRKEKTNLQEYLLGLNLKMDISYQVVEPTREWPETVLLSQSHWTDFNVVCLPDTDFLPVETVDQMFDVMSNGGCDLVFATFDIEDGRSWGMIRNKNNGGFEHCEKPAEVSNNTQAWGLFGFRSDAGEQVLKQMLSSTFDHKWRGLPGRVTTVALNHFVDLTR